MILWISTNKEKISFQYALSSLLIIPPGGICVCVNFLLSFFSITSVVTQNTFKVCLGTFYFNLLLFFRRSNKKEKETLPIFWLLDKPELPGSFPHRCVLILACYKLVVSLWIPDNKDQSASISIFLYCKSLLIKIKGPFE